MPVPPTTDAMRRATPADAADMARLVDLAGEGLPYHFWSGLAAPGQDPWSVGEDRARRDGGAFSWRNALVSEAGGAVAALLVTYPIGDTPEPIGDGMPPVFVPLQELENLALGTQYVNVLATYPRFRREGRATRLLAAAEAAADGRPLSIIVSDGNAPAMAVYARCGYRTAAARPIVTADGWSCEGRNWTLMIKEPAGRR